MELEDDKEKLKSIFRCELDGKRYYSESIECTNCKKICCPNHSKNYHDEDKGFDYALCSECYPIKEKEEEEKEREKYVEKAKIIFYLLAVLAVIVLVFRYAR